MKRVYKDVVSVIPHLMRNPGMFFKKCPSFWIPAFAGMTKWGLIITAIIIILTAIFSYASENPVPDKSLQGQVWIEAEGEAVMGDIETQKEVKERAKRDAQSKALEKAVGVFVKSHTLVSNSQLAEDLIYAAVRGKIEKVDIIKEGWDEKDRNLYRVKLKTLIKPVYPEKGEGISLKISLSKADISVPPAIRSGWWNSGNGSVPTCSGRFPTGISSSASRKSCAGTSSMTGIFLPI